MKLLIIEDEEALNEALVRGFKNKGYTVDACTDGMQGLQKAVSGKYNVIILDLNLPGLDGIEIGKKIRAEEIDTPIIALTARDSLEMKLKGFDSGFDDYLTKPFDFAELVVRVQALVRRGLPNKDEILKTGKISLDPKKREVKLAESTLDLTAKEFSILEYLLSYKGIVVKNAELIEAVWSEDADLVNPPIRAHIKNLRKKIGDTDYQIIQTIPGVGYKIV